MVAKSSSTTTNESQKFVNDSGGDVAVNTVTEVNTDNTGPIEVTDSSTDTKKIKIVGADDNGDDSYLIRASKYREMAVSFSAQDKELFNLMIRKLINIEKHLEFLSGEDPIDEGENNEFD